MEAAPPGMSGAGLVEAADDRRALPPGICWQPAGDKPGDGGSVEALEAHAKTCHFGLEDVKAEDFSQGKYEVVHYAPAAYGLAFGPLSIGHVVRFCQDMIARLGRFEHVVFQYDTTTAGRANSAVLLGAFLVLCKQWSAADVARVLRIEAELEFLCSWTRYDKTQRRPVMTVKDCWDGLEVARNQGWVRIGPRGIDAGGSAAGMPGLQDGHLTDLAVSQYRRTLLQYDAVWLVPAEVLVMADPITTIKDPNPATCPSFESATVDSAEKELEPVSPVSTQTDENWPPLTVEKPAQVVPYSDDQRGVPEVQVRSPCGGGAIDLCAAPEGPKRSGDASAAPSTPDLSTAEPSKSGVPPASSGAGSESLSNSRELEKPMKRTRSKATSEKGDLREPEECPTELGFGMVPDIDIVNDEEEGNTSLHSVCKQYQEGVNTQEELKRPKALDFVSFLRHQDVKLVVRTNASNEEGLKELGGSYSPATLEKHGVHHLEFFVKDTNGGLPQTQLIRSFLMEVDRINQLEMHQRELASFNNASSVATTVTGPVLPDMPPSPASVGTEGSIPTRRASSRSMLKAEPQTPAVVVHCKSGFGRSVLFACLLVIHRYDVPGRALLGWARIVRPGAFTVPEQEKFLASIGGRDDLHRIVGMPGAEEQSCKCCAVQ